MDILKFLTAAMKIWYTPAADICPSQQGCVGDLRGLFFCLAVVIYVLWVSGMLVQKRECHLEQMLHF